MLNTIVFDIDGTLGDTLPLCIESYRRVAEEVTGRRPSVEDVCRHFGKSDRGVLAALTKLSPEDEGLPMARFIEIYEALHPSMAPAPFEGAAEILKTLRDELGLRLAMVTGKEVGTATSTVRRFGLEGLFEWCGYGDPYRVSKDDCLRELMDLWKISPDNLVYIGDTAADIEACRRANVRIINAAWAESAAEEAEACLALKPDYRLERFEDLLPLIRQLAAR